MKNYNIHKHFNFVSNGIEASIRPSNRFTVLILFIFISTFLGFAQDPSSLINEGKALERKFKEEEAFEKYKEAFSIQPGNITAAMKCAELSGNLGRRSSGIVRINAWMNQAMAFADAALQIDSNNADAISIKALTFKNLAETEEKKDKATEYLREWRIWAEKALIVDSTHARASHFLGAWHLEVLTQGSIRKASAKLLYGGLPEANIGKAISLMEHCKEAEPYYCANFLDLAKAYHFTKFYEKAIQTLERLAKLPTRRIDDVGFKAEGKELLQKLQ
jgi:tetratricopeptide (TPR) repeat protein